MDLKTAKRVVSGIQRALGLNPDTVPELEFRVELFMIRNRFQSNCVRINPAENAFLDDDSEIPCVNIIISADDIIDGPNAEILRLTYYHGDNIPAGPRHALIITDLIKKKVIYQRQRQQDPATEWICNSYVQAQVDFAFTAQGDDTRFMTRDIFYSLLRNCSTDKGSPNKGAAVIEYLKVDHSTEFLAEVAYLNYWDMTNSGAPAEEGIDFNVGSNPKNDTILVTVSCDHRDDVSGLTFIYERKSGICPYGLTIVDGNNPVYKRNAGQDEATEWIQNDMANSPLVTDGYGNPLFTSSSIQT